MSATKVIFASTHFLCPQPRLYLQVATFYVRNQGYICKYPTFYVRNQGYICKYPLSMSATKVIFASTHFLCPQPRLYLQVATFYVRNQGYICKYPLSMSATKVIFASTHLSMSATKAIFASSHFLCPQPRLYLQVPTFYVRNQGYICKYPLSMSATKAIFASTHFLCPQPRLYLQVPTFYVRNQGYICKYPTFYVRNQGYICIKFLKLYKLTLVILLGSACLSVYGRIYLDASSDAPSSSWITFHIPL